MEEAIAQVKDARRSAFLHWWFSKVLKASNSSLYTYLYSERNEGIKILTYKATVTKGKGQKMCIYRKVKEK